MTNYMKGFSHGCWLGFMLGSVVAVSNQKKQSEDETVDKRHRLALKLPSFSDVPELSQAHAAQAAS